jgi:predicted O-linked N-acetylglucosamine transferase (SPINDLY family)
MARFRGCRHHLVLEVFPGMIFGTRRALARARRALEAGDLEQAKSECLALVARRRPPPQAVHLLARTLLRRGELDQALRALTDALVRDAGDAVAHNLAGMVHRERGDAVSAEKHLRRAVDLDPGLADAHINLGAVLNEQGRATEAERSLRRAVAADPGNAIGWCNLGLVLAEQGSPDEAERCFGAALKAEPEYFYARLTLVMNKLREVYDDEAQLVRSRNEYRQALADLKNWLPKDPRGAASAADSVGWVTPFFLAYQGQNDRDLQRTYGELVCELMRRRYPVPSTAPASRARARLRVGFASGFFYDHSVWKNPIRGWIENLDRSRFEIFGYYTGQRQDAATGAARRACAQFAEGLAFEALAERIRGDALDVLVFPELGMDATTVKLAALRLAPVQCTSWGHPSTSGLPTIDYFLSSDLMEPADGESHYTERLVRLPNLSVHYTPPAYSPRSLERAALGLREGTVVFYCAQSLFKYLPQHDSIFPRIAQRLPDSQFVFIAAHRSAALTERFRQRLARAFAAESLDASRHVVVLPRMDGATFQAVARICDVFLDNPSWSGCNSTLECMAEGLVPVTWPGATMRAHHTAPNHRRVALDELIAHDRVSSVQLAARLGGDARWRREMRERMGERLPKLFGDLDCVRALEDFLQSASESARKPAPSARA